MPWQHGNHHLMLKLSLMISCCSYASTINLCGGICAAEAVPFAWHTKHSYQF